MSANILRLQHHWRGARKLRARVVTRIRTEANDAKKETKRTVLTCVTGQEEKVQILERLVQASECEKG